MNFMQPVSKSMFTKNRRLRRRNPRSVRLRPVKPCLLIKFYGDMHAIDLPKMSYTITADDNMLPAYSYTDTIPE